MKIAILIIIGHGPMDKSGSYNNVFYSVKGRMNYSRLVAFHITECRHLLLEEHEQKSQPERQNDPRGVILVGCPRGLVEESGKYSLPFPIYNQLVHLITRQVTMPLLSVAGRNPK